MAQRRMYGSRSQDRAPYRYDDPYRTYGDDDDRDDDRGESRFSGSRSVEGMRHAGEGVPPSDWLPPGAAPPRRYGELSSESYGPQRYGHNPPSFEPSFNPARQHAYRGTMGGSGWQGGPASAFTGGDTQTAVSWGEPGGVDIGRHFEPGYGQPNYGGVPRAIPSWNQPQHQQGTSPRTYGQYGQAQYAQPDRPSSPYSGGGFAQQPHYGATHYGSSQYGGQGNTGAETGGWSQANQSLGQSAAGFVQNTYQPSQEPSSGFDRSGYQHGGYGHTNYGQSVEGHESTGATQHDPEYRRWRHAQLSSHDRDYATWRGNQARQYDEDYHHYSQQRHSEFTGRFEDWRKENQGHMPKTASGVEPAGNAGTHASASDVGSRSGTSDAEGAGSVSSGARPDKDKDKSGGKSH